MNMHADKSQENNKQSVGHAETQKQSGGASTVQFVDNRPEAIAQRKLQEMVDNSHQAQQAAQLQAMANNSPQVSQLKAVQRMINNSTQVRQAAQLQAMADSYVAQQRTPIQKQASSDGKAKANHTGLPDTLKSGIENLSGYSMDDVKVHYNSSKPAQLQAHAYAQGTDIHVAGGQEKHLPHEAWHVVQQKQGRVAATTQMKGFAVNDTLDLEREADRQGDKAANMTVHHSSQNDSTLSQQAVHSPLLQGMFDWLHNYRKVGAEITEANTGGNGLSKASPGASWAGVPNKANQWPHTVQLPDNTGANHNWKVATYAAIGAHFQLSGSKTKWMKWGNTMLTEDYGEYEWIVKHPDAPFGVSEYRTRLNETNTSRTALRSTLSGKGSTQLIVAKSANPGPNDAFYIDLGGTNKVSSQITIETTDAEVTAKALVHGLVSGLNRQKVVSKTDVPPADPIITDYLNKAANRVKVNNTKMHLVVAYLMADLAHKVANMISGPGWGNDVAANFKDWRLLFPKSHPFYMTQMAIDGPVNLAKIARVRLALTGKKTEILRDLSEMITKMILKKGPRIQWTRSGPNFAQDHTDVQHLVDHNSPEYQQLILQDLLVGGDLSQLGARTGQFETLVASGANANFLVDEFNNTVNALTDRTKVEVDVVRSSGFAEHGPATKAFAFEDRAEIEDSFPGLKQTYNRIVTIVDRY